MVDLMVVVQVLPAVAAALPALVDLLVDGEDLEEMQPQLLLLHMVVLVQDILMDGFLVEEGEVDSFQMLPALAATAGVVLEG